MPVLSFALLAALLGCADKQYVAVPGAYVFVGDDPQTQATAQAPVVHVVPAGDRVAGSCGHA